MSSELIFAAMVAALVFVVGRHLVRWRVRRTRIVGRHASGDGPANLRYTCAGCAAKFTHTRRTLLAWRKGRRSFYCKACHTKWRGHVPLAKGRLVRTREPAPAGCLGVALLLVAVPVTALVGAARYFA